MSRHEAQVSWRSDGDFTTGTYSRVHEWRFGGGQVVRATSGVVAEALSDPFAVDPEQALVASASSCHMLWFLDLARQAGFDVASYQDQAIGEMERIARERFAFTRIVLRPRITFVGRQPTPAELAELHHEAHERCFIANSLKAEVVVEGV